MEKQRDILEAKLFLDDEHIDMTRSEGIRPTELHYQMRNISDASRQSDERQSKSTIVVDWNSRVTREFLAASTGDGDHIILYEIMKGKSAFDL